MNKKYELIMENPMIVSGRKLYRVRALKDLGCWVKKGNIGGYIESEDNLSHGGKCWVFDNSMIYDGARLQDDAIMCNYAKAYGAALISGNSAMFVYAMAYENAKIMGNSRAGGHSIIHGDSMIFDNASIDGNAEMYEQSRLYGNAIACDNAKLSENAEVFDDAMAFKNVWLAGNSSISDMARVTSGMIQHDAQISSTSDYLSISPIGPDNEIFIAYKCSDGIIKCNIDGCHGGSLKDFLSTMEKKYPSDTKLLGQYATIIDLVNAKLG